MVPNTALSMDRYYFALENVKVTSSTLVVLTHKRNRLLRASLWAARIAGFGLIRLTNNWVSTNFKVTLDSGSLFFKKNSSWLLYIWSVAGRWTVNTAELYKCRHVFGHTVQSLCSLSFYFSDRQIPCFLHLQQKDRKVVNLLLHHTSTHLLDARWPPHYRRSALTRDKLYNDTMIQMIQRNVTLTDKRIKEIIRSSREILLVQNRPVSFC